MSKIKSLFFIVFFLSATTLSLAKESPESIIKEKMVANTQDLMSVVTTIKNNPNMEKSKMYLLIDDSLKDTFAFRRMAGRIMGRYARGTTPEERDLFVENFKQQLFDSYIDSLISSGEVDIEITDVRLLPQNENRGVVDMQIKNSSGEVFVVNYSIFENNKVWMIENVIVEGVNLGLAFRDSFYQEMEKNRNDLSRTIKNWNVKLENN
jgi:phospholipid transport system substrate-binding protein